MSYIGKIRVGYILDEVEIVAIEEASTGEYVPQRNVRGYKL